MKKLGIIGGLGPMATAHFMTLVTQMSDAEKDQEHIEIILRSRPSIPDRTDYIIGKSELSPEADLIELSKELSDAGADILAIPCFTAYHFYESISKAADIPVIHPIFEAAAHLKALDIRSVGVLATDGMLVSNLYQDVFTVAKIEVILPETEEQKQIMSLIYDEIKSGREGDIAKLHSASQHLFKSGAEMVLLGCSELSLMKRDYLLAKGHLDVLEVLARSAVRKCGKLRKEYQNLIT
jgi:aspartate racemase